MATDNETVRKVCAEIETQRCQTVFAAAYVIDWRDRILAAHEREIAAKDAEIARLKEVLKKTVDEIIFGIDALIEMANAIGEAKRIMKEGENND